MAPVATQTHAKPVLKSARCLGSKERKIFVDGYETKADMIAYRRRYIPLHNVHSAC